MEKSNNKVAIVGIFWDGYYDIWEDFLELKEKFWKECPYPLYIVNESKDLNFSKNYEVTVIHAGDDALYSRKVQKALDVIEADYFLLLLEDFFFSKPIDKGVLNDVLCIISKHNLSYMRMPMAEFKGSIKGSKYNGYDTIHNIETNSEYTVSCQPSIWKKDFLRKCIGEGNYNAWVFEGIYAMSRYAHTQDFLQSCKIESNNILGLVHGALQGKMLPKTVDIIRAAGYELKNRREMMSLKDNIAHERKEWLQSILPLPLQKFLKRFKKSKPVLEKYTDEIKAQMSQMGLN